MSMKLFDSLIRGAEKRFGAAEPKRYAYSPDKAWPESESFELVMQRDAACELGAECGVNFTCVTADPELVSADEILVYGDDLGSTQPDAPYARIAFLRVGNIAGEDGEDTEAAFRAIQHMDFVKYHVFPKGFMLRTSSDSGREQVRLSKGAVSAGISFEAVGDTFIRRYKRDAHVQAVKLIFVTAADADYAALQKDSASAKDILLTLSKIMEGLPTDCGSCSLKSVCDEVEGMKELHFGKAQQKKQ